MEAAVALREQPEIRELFEVLEGSGLKKERQEVESLVNYLEGMESQLGEVIKELKEVRGGAVGADSGQGHKSDRRPASGQRRGQGAGDWRAGCPCKNKPCPFR